MDMSKDMQMDMAMDMSHGQMFFSWSTSSHALVEGWTTATTTGLVMAAVTGLLSAVSLEALRCYSVKEKLAQRILQPSSTSLPVVKRLMLAITHILDVSLAYVLMLLVMTFNLYVTLAVVVGAGLGHFVLRPALLRHVAAMAKRRLCAVRIINPWRGDNEDGCDDCNNTDAKEGRQSEDKNETKKCVEVDDGFDVNDSAKVEGSFPYTAATQQEDEADASDPMLQCRQFSVRGKETSV